MPSKSSGPQKGSAFQVVGVSEKTDRIELFWLTGKRRPLEVYRVPIEHLYFNIENGRYADKMVQLRQDNPGVEIDPRDERWKGEIFKMLKGEYTGAEKDREPFDRLKKDILAREQLHPGVVLNDGGVLDGNRRFAVLTHLHDTEKNPTRFEYFDAVILPENVTSEDRWRIEAGLQIGKDERLDYSPVNRLLKIKEGLELFADSGDPAQEIANTLIGISKDEVDKDIQKIRLIDTYLSFIQKPGAYGLVSDVMERFEEAVNILDSARKIRMSPPDLKLLNLKLFSYIRFPDQKLMDNWQLREIRAAIGAAGRGQNGRRKNDKALKRLLEVSDSKELHRALIQRDSSSKAVIEEKQRAETFIDEMEAAENADKPFRLAERANTYLQQLKDTLEDGNVGKSKDWETQEKKLKELLDSITKLITTSASLLKKIKGKGK